MLLLCFIVYWPCLSFVGVQDPFAFVATESVVFGGEFVVVVGGFFACCTVVDVVGIV